MVENTTSEKQTSGLIMEGDLPYTRAKRGSRQNKREEKGKTSHPLLLKERNKETKKQRNEETKHACTHRGAATVRWHTNL